MKAFKNINAARKAANGMPLIRVGKLYIVTGQDLVGTSLTEIAVVSPTGKLTGYVTARHLDRLGNANWATPERPNNETSFPQEAMR
jgi:hypothetical protein